MSKTVEKVSHTPGPWTIDGDFIRDSKCDYLIARVAWGEKLNSADVALIASAPDLLVSLKAMLKRVSDQYADHKADWTFEDAQICEQASAAIAKAEVIW